MLAFDPEWMIGQTPTIIERRNSHEIIILNKDVLAYSYCVFHVLCVNVSITRKTNKLNLLLNMLLSITANPPQCGPEDWTPWLNADNPFDGCDMETLSVIAEKYPDLVCESPEAMDARVFLTELPFDPTLPNIRFGTFGFECCNRFGRSCNDYEVRFCCPTGVFLYSQVFVKLKI